MTCHSEIIVSMPPMTTQVIIYLDAAGLGATRVVDGQPPDVAGWETIVFPPSHPSLRVGMVTHEG